MNHLRPLLTRLAIALCTFRATAQFKVQSTWYLGGDSSWVEIWDEAATADGGILFTGFVYEAKTRGNLPVFPNGNEECLVGKLDSNLKVVWLKAFGSQAGDEGIVCRALPAGKGFIVGCGTGGNDGDVSGNHGGRDMWLLRLDASGNKLWSRCYGGPGDETLSDLVLTSDGGFLIAGTHQGPLTGGDVPKTYETSLGSDWLLVKIDSLGVKQWSQVFGGSFSEEDTHVIAVPTGYYLAGSSMSVDHECNDTSWHTSGVYTGSDCYLLKLDLNGALLWSKSYGGTNQETLFNVLWDDRDSSIVMVGNSKSNDYHMHGLHGGPNGDLSIVKTDRNGVLQWASMLGVPGKTYDGVGTSILKGPGKDYVVGGARLYADTLAPPPDAIAWDDFIVYLVDSAGTERYHKTFGCADTAAAFPNNFWHSRMIPIRNGFAFSAATVKDITEVTNLYYSPNAYQLGTMTFLSFGPVAVEPLNGPVPGLVVYPNPANDKVSFDYTLTGADGPVSLQIADMAGRVTYSGLLRGRSGRVNYDTRSLGAGVYVYRVVGARGIVGVGRLSVVR
jgi:hypothetical protein